MFLQCSVSTVNTEHCICVESRHCQSKNSCQWTHTLNWSVFFNWFQQKEVYFQKTCVNCSEQQLYYPDDTAIWSPFWNTGDQLDACYPINKLPCLASAQIGMQVPRSPFHSSPSLAGQFNSLQRLYAANLCPSLPFIPSLKHHSGRGWVKEGCGVCVRWWALCSGTLMNLAFAFTRKLLKHMRANGKSLMARAHEHCFRK